MRNNQMNWAIAVGAVALLGTAVVTLRAAERATQHAAAQSAVRDAFGEAIGMRAGHSASTDTARGGSGSPSLAGAASHAVAPAGTAKQHPPASAPEESATIADDPTTAPDPSQSADNNVSFPTDI